MSQRVQCNISAYEDAVRAEFWKEALLGHYERALQVFEEGMKKVKQYKQLADRPSAYPRFKEVYER